MLPAMQTSNGSFLLVVLAIAMTSSSCVDDPAELETSEPGTTEEVTDLDPDLASVPSPAGFVPLDEESLDSCGTVCQPASHCEIPCTAPWNGGEWITCGDYGYCTEQCANVCSSNSRCDLQCYSGGGITSCQQWGSCNPPPDCLVEFWTEYGYTGVRDCYGTQDDLQQALNGSGKLTINQVLSNDQYSSFRTIEQVCADRGISPCRIGNMPNTIKTTDTIVYADPALSGSLAAVFKDAVNAFPDLRKKRWGDFPIMPNVDNKISSISVNYLLKPVCYRVVDGGNCPLCLDGGGWIFPYSCAAIANISNSQGWYHADKVKNVWVYFDAASGAPTKFTNKNGTLMWGLDTGYYLVFPVPNWPNRIEWHFGFNVPAVYFQSTVPSPF